MFVHEPHAFGRMRLGMTNEGEVVHGDHRWALVVECNEVRLVINRGSLSTEAFRLQDLQHGLKLLALTPARTGTQPMAWGKLFFQPGLQARKCACRNTL